MFGLKIWALIFVVGIVLTCFGVLCANQKKEAEINWNGNYTLFHQDSVEIIPDTLPLWAEYENLVKVSEIVATSERGDEAHIVISFGEDEEIIVSGTINDSPIVSADVEISMPNKIYREELGHTAVIIQTSITDAREPLIGVSYEPLHFYRGRLRLGLQGAIEPVKWNRGVLGVRTAYRRGNLSLGITNGINQNLEYEVGVNFGFYL